MSRPPGAEIEKLRKVQEESVVAANQSNAEMFRLTKDYFFWSKVFLFITAMATLTSAIIMWLRT